MAGQVWLAPLWRCKQSRGECLLGRGGNESRVELAPTRFKLPKQARKLDAHVGGIDNCTFPVKASELPNEDVVGAVVHGTVWSC